MMLKILVTVLFAAGIALADEAMCLSLCEPCKDSKDETCAKIESVCSCAELFETAEAEEAGKEARNAIRGQALKNLLYEECSNGRCVSKIWFEGAELKNFQAEESTDFDIKAVPEPELTPLQDKCAELCGMLDASEGSRLETACGCQAHVQDSLKLVQFRLARLEGVQTAAAEIAEFCAEKEACSVEVALNGTTFEVATIRRLEDGAQAGYDRQEVVLETILSECKGAKANTTCDIRFTFHGTRIKWEKRDNPSSSQSSAKGSFRKANAVQAAKAVNDFCFAEEFCDMDVSLRGETFELVALRPHKGAFPYKEGAYREEEPKEENGKNGNEGKNSYGGFMLYSGSGSWSYSKDYFDWVSSGGVEAGLGYLHRWYFYRWGSFQMGFNANYSYIDLGSDSYYVSRALGTIEYDLLYHNVSVEVPLQLRLGVPFIYGTFQFTMRKQVWSLLVIDDGDETEYSYSTLAMDDWRFLGHAGLGFELSRHFLVDVLFVLFDLGTAGDYVEQDEGFRIQLNFAW